MPQFYTQIVSFFKSIYKNEKFPIYSLILLFFLYLSPLLFFINKKIPLIFSEVSADKFDLVGANFTYFIEKFGLFGLFRFELLYSLFSKLAGGVAGYNLLWIFSFGLFIFGLYFFLADYLGKRWALFASVFFMSSFSVLLFFSSIEIFFIIGLFPFLLFSLKKFLKEQRLSLWFWLLLIVFLVILSHNFIVGLLFFVVACGLLYGFDKDLLDGAEYKSSISYQFFGSVLLVLVISVLLAESSLLRLIFDSFVGHDYIRFAFPYSLIYSLLPDSILQLLPFFGVLFSFVAVWGFFSVRKARFLLYFLVIAAMFSIEAIDFAGLFGIAQLPMPGSLLLAYDIGYLLVFFGYLFVFFLFLFFLMILKDLFERKYLRKLGFAFLLVVLLESFSFIPLQQPMFSLPDFDVDVLYYPVSVFDGSLLFADGKDNIRFDLYDTLSFEKQSGFQNFLKQNYLNMLESGGVKKLIADDVSTVAEFSFLGFEKRGSMFVADLNTGTKEYLDISYNQNDQELEEFSSIALQAVGDFSGSLKINVAASEGFKNLNVFLNGELIETFVLTQDFREFYVDLSRFSNGDTIELVFDEDDDTNSFYVNSISFSDAMYETIDSSLLDLSGYSLDAGIDIGESEEVSLIVLDSFLSAFVDMGSIDDRLLEFEPEYLSFLLLNELNTREIEKMIILPNKELHPLAWQKYEEIFSLFGVSYELVREQGVSSVYALSFFDVDRGYVYDGLRFSDDGFVFDDALGDVFAHFAYCNIGEGDLDLVVGGEERNDFEDGCGKKTEKFDARQAVNFLSSETKSEVVSYHDFKNISFSNKDSYDPILIEKSGLRLNEFFDYREDPGSQKISLAVPNPSVSVAHFPLTEKAFISFDISAENFYERSSDIGFGFSFREDLTTFNDYFPDMDFVTNNAQNITFVTDEIKEVESPVLSQQMKRVTFGFDHGIVVLIVDGSLVAQGTVDDVFVDSFAVIVQGCCDLSKIDIFIENISYELET